MGPVYVETLRDLNVSLKIENVYTLSDSDISYAMIEEIVKYLDQCKIASSWTETWFGILEFYLNLKKFYRWIIIYFYLKNQTFIGQVQSSLRPIETDLR